MEWWFPTMHREDCYFAFADRCARYHWVHHVENDQPVDMINVIVRNKLQWPEMQSNDEFWNTHILNRIEEVECASGLAQVAMRLREWQFNMMTSDVGNIGPAQHPYFPPTSGCSELRQTDPPFLFSKLQHQSASCILIPIETVFHQAIVNFLTM